MRPLYRAGQRDTCTVRSQPVPYFCVFASSSRESGNVDGVGGIALTLFSFLEQLFLTKGSACTVCFTSKSFLVKNIVYVVSDPINFLFFSCFLPFA